jgi:stage II sporulation protein D
MPKEWPLEALKAQAVAARTYAVRGLVEGRSFDLYSDWRSQVYYGVDSEAPASTRAVRETRGQILTYDGKPAQVFYFSSSGGRTLSALDVFGTDVPYLVSVDDPWDEESPNHRWASQLLSGAQVAKRFGLTGVVADASLVPGTPGKPAVLRLTTAAGGTREARLSDVRARLGLKSTGFTLGVLRLDLPSTKVPAGALVLTGVAKAVEAPVLEQRAASGAWTTAKRLEPSATGEFKVRLKIAATTAYRLSAAGLAGPVVTVRVAP